jgi:precorrin-6Y C5,15-methyltransferase (decarboxylating)
MSAAVQREVRRPWLALLGIGEDGIDGLTGPARALLQAATLVVGGARHLALADGLISGERLPWPSPMRAAYPAILARAGQDVAVLASGDPYCYGVGSAFATLVPASEIICIPAPSAFSLACARLGWAMQDVTTLSFCGRPLQAAIPLLQPGARLLALSADAATPGALASLLTSRGFGGSVLHVLEALGGKRERARTCMAGSGVPGDVGSLNTLAIEVVAGPDAVVLPLAAGLPDALFENDGQLTKQEVRAVTLSALAPRAGETLWDIGAGSGSVAIEWCLRGRANRALAIEARPERAARAGRNALALGAAAMEVVVGEAPGALAGLQPPDAVFIGGGLQRPGVLEAAWDALRPGGRLVANAVALDTQAKLLELQARLGGTLTRLAVERLDQIGTMRALRPAMAVVQWAAVKR